MNCKWVVIPLFFYLLFLVGMCFIGLGKFASIAFADGWWRLTKDVASILGSLGTALGVPWAIWLYFRQRDKDRVDKWHELARSLLSELTEVLKPEKLLANQLTINFLLFRLRSYIGDFNQPIHSDYLSALRTHINQLFQNLKSDDLVYCEIPGRLSLQPCDRDLIELHGGERNTTFSLAAYIVVARKYHIQRFGNDYYVSLEPGFDPQLLSKLVLIAQPICIGNCTSPASDVLWKEEDLKKLFGVLPNLIAGYLYLAYSDAGHALIQRLDQDINN